MKEYIHMPNGTTLQRVPKNTARRTYMCGHPVTLCPCDLHPLAHPGFTYTAHREKGLPGIIEHTGSAAYFDGIVEEFTEHQCYGATGKYPAYWVPVRLVDTF